MNYSNLFLIISIIILLFGNYRVINRLRKTTNKQIVDLSLIWKIGLMVLIIGAIITFFTFSNIYDSINENTEETLIAKLVKENLISALKFFLIGFCSIVNWFLLKRFRFSI